MRAFDAGADLLTIDDNISKKRIGDGKYKEALVHMNTHRYTHKYIYIYTFI